MGRTRDIPVSNADIGVLSNLLVGLLGSLVGGALDLVCGGRSVMVLSEGSRKEASRTGDVVSGALDGIHDDGWWLVVRVVGLVIACVCEDFCFDV